MLASGAGMLDKLLAGERCQAGDLAAQQDLPEWVIEVPDRPPNRA
jgi:hypothetical protein